MSGSTAKQQRREVRRAMGPAGLAAVNGLGAVVHSTIVPTVDAAIAALGKQSAQIDRLTSDVLGQRRILDDLAERQFEQDRRIDKLYAPAPRSTFRRRLGWLVFG